MNVGLVASRWSNLSRLFIRVRVPVSRERELLSQPHEFGRKGGDKAMGSIGSAGLLQHALAHCGRSPTSSVKA